MDINTTQKAGEKISTCVICSLEELTDNMKSMKQDTQDERIRQQNKVKNEIAKRKRQTGDQNITITKIINKFETA